MTDECTCDQCGRPLRVGDWPLCGGKHSHGTPSLKVVQDSIPGGLVIENMGPEPVTVYSHSERRMEMAKRGLVEAVRHVGSRGGDRSAHTSRWI